MRSCNVEGAIYPSSKQLLDPVPGHEDGDFVFDSRFYQTVDSPEYERRQRNVNDYIGSGNAADMPIGVYQRWSELDWKQPHGTYAAVLRWRDKLQEEAIQETPDALYKHEADHDTGSKRAAVEELGDTFWTTCALTSNAGQSIDRALQVYLWGDGLISHRESELTLGQIDEIVMDLANTPWFSPLDAIDPSVNIEHIKLDEMEPSKNLFFRSMTLLLLCEQQFGHGEHDGFVLSWHRQIGQEKIAPRAADQVMMVAWYACHFAGSSLAEVAEANINKLRPRVAANLIDKKDGDRSIITSN
jgi:hypothetical protein